MGLGHAILGNSIADELVTELIEYHNNDFKL